MQAVKGPICSKDINMVDFALRATDDKIYSLSDFDFRPNTRAGLIIMFISPSCPFTIKIIDKIAEDMKYFIKTNMKVIAINSSKLLEDSFDNMKKMSHEKNFCFPFLYDNEQIVAQALNVIITPDFLVFNNEKKLKYRGRGNYEDYNYDNHTKQYDTSKNYCELVHVGVEVLKTNDCNYINMSCSEGRPIL